MNRFKKVLLVNPMDTQQCGYTPSPLGILYLDPMNWKLVFKDTLKFHLTDTLAEKIILPKDYFEVVVVNHVLEHMTNPVKSLKKNYKALKKGGLLVLGVPNIESIMFYFLGQNWQALRANEHIFQFNKFTLFI